MITPRIDALADILVQHSTRVTSGDFVLIDGNTSAAPLLLSCYRKVLEAGANPRLNVGFEEAQELLLTHGSDAQLDFLDPVSKFQADSIQAAIRIRSTDNTRALAEIDPTRLAKTMVARRPVMDQIIENVRWVLCDYPTPALAQEAEMSFSAYEDFLYGATNIDWSAMSAQLSALKKRLEHGTQIRIVGPDTDLTLNTGGRVWEPADGRKNMPDGEIFTAPIENSVNGYIIQRHTKNILFDEKMGGTVHLAVGRAYEFTGGKNQSAVHWDMIKDLRTGGTLYVDNEVLQKDGVFTS